MEVFRVVCPERRRACPQGLDPGDVGRRPKWEDAVVEGEDFLGIIGIRWSAGFELLDGGGITVGAGLGQCHVEFDS